MRTRLLLGPAGSGKTFRCLAEIRRALKTSPDGLPLILLAPKQSTYQLERRVLSDPELPGYTRLQILPFERLALFLFDRLGQAAPKRLDEEGRLMVLRSLLARKRQQLRIFHGSARLTGFAIQLSDTLRELQREGQTPASLREMAASFPATAGLHLKLHDLATLLEDYLAWLQERSLLDDDELLPSAIRLLQARLETGSSTLVLVLVLVLVPRHGRDTRARTILLRPP